MAIAAAIVAFGFIGSRLLGVVRTTAIADAFGSAPELDAYNIAFRIPDLIFQVLAGSDPRGRVHPGVLAAVPARKRRSGVAARQPHPEHRDGRDGAFSACSRSSSRRVLVPLLAPGLGKDIGRQDELTDEAVELTRIMLLSPLFFAVSGIVTGILTGGSSSCSRRISPMLYNLAIIFGALVLADRWGVNGLAVGVVWARAAPARSDPRPLPRTNALRTLSFGRGDAAVREVGRLMGPRVVGLAAAQLNFVVTGIFASKVGASAIPN